MTLELLKDKPLFILRDEADYEQALEALEVVWGAEEGTLAFDYALHLGRLIEDYEAARYPAPPPDPIEAIEWRMVDLGWTRKGLEPHIGNRSRVSKILNRRQRLTLPMIRKLSAAMGIPLGILVQDYELVSATPEAAA